MPVGWEELSENGLHLRLDVAHNEDQSRCRTRLRTSSWPWRKIIAVRPSAPFDLDEMELPRYKGLREKWHRWETTRTICRRFGVLLGEALVQGGK